MSWHDTHMVLLDLLLRKTDSAICGMRKCTESSDFGNANFGIAPAVDLLLCDTLHSSLILQVSGQET